MIWDNFIKGWKNIFNFTGRASRAEYWLFNIGSLLFITLLVTAILLPVAFVVDGDKETINKVSALFIVVIIPYIFGTLTITVRRIRDMGASGWWTLLFLPVNAILYAIPSIVIGFIPSKNPDAVDSSSSSQQKASPEIKDFHYTPEYKPKSDFGSEYKSSSSRPATRLPLKDFN